MNAVTTLPRPQRLPARAPFREPGGALFLKALAVTLGEEVETAQAAVAAGRYAAEKAQKDEVASVRVSARSAPEMAESVARAALEAAGARGEDLTHLAYTHIHAHGHRRFWQPAAGLQRALGADGALGVTLSHGCNGQMLALVEAGLVLAGLGGLALSVAADRFAGTGFDRWSSDAGLVYGDAAAAALLSPTGGFARVRFVDIENASLFEALHRMGAADHDGAREWDITGAKARWMEANGKDAFFAGVGRALEALRERLETRAGVRPGDVAAVVTPFVGWSVARTTYARVFHPFAPATSRAEGARIGHTGAADQLVGLARLLETGVVGAGDAVLLVGAGSGFSFGTMVVDILETPRRTAQGAFA